MTLIELSAFSIFQYAKRGLSRQVSEDPFAALIDNPYNELLRNTGATGDHYSINNNLASVLREPSDAQKVLEKTSFYGAKQT